MELSIVVLTGTVGLFLLSSWRWPLTGDASLMHYIAFMANHGFAPYRDLRDVNLPGAYLPSWLFQKLFGTSAVGWRLYDFSLLLVIFYGLWRVAERTDRLAAVWAAALFALIHGRDGAAQAGQRDLAAAAAILLALAVCRKRDINNFSASWCAGCLLGLALLIKPTLFLVLCLPVAKYRKAAFARRNLLAAYVGVLCPLTLCALWLVHFGLLGSFLSTMRTLGPLHASLGHVPTDFLWYNCFSPILPLTVVGIFVSILCAFQRWGQTLDSVAPYLTLYVACFAGLVSCLLQRKAYSYQRYPFLVILLFVLCVLFTKKASEFSLAGLLSWTTLV